MLVLAEAGTDEATAALITAEPVESFREKIQQTFGVPWATVLIRAQAKVRADLIASAIKAARLGDWKPYLSLEKAGIQLSLVEREETPATAPKPRTIAETEARIAELEKEIAEKKAAATRKLDLTGFEGVTPVLE